MPAWPLYPVSALRAVEALALPGARPPLMERAGAAAADLARRLLGSSAGDVLVLCGPGNNGGDGFVLARHLLQAGHRVCVVCTADPARLPADAAAARQTWLDAGGTTQTHFPAAPASGWALAVDALFGIGLQRPPTGQYAAWIEAFNALDCPRLALDIPSGLDADSGRRLEVCVDATHTVTFIAAKPGVCTLDGPDTCGVLEIAPLGLDPEALVPAPGRTISPALFAECLRPRRRNTHKGSFGDAALIGGAPGMVGAALLAGRAAAFLGAGRVLVGLLAADALAVDPLRPELMFRNAHGLLAENAGAYAIGPGLGQSDAARSITADALRLQRPLVLDADALNLVARHAELQHALTARDAPTLLTPHPAEAARLLACSTADIQTDRIAQALALARRFNALVVLKGCGSVVAAPDGAWWINTSGNPAMATAGMGDVLTGLIVALLAQGWPARSALLAGVHLHGCAADLCCAEQGLHAGLLAGEILEPARRCLNRWLGAPEARP
ncbi:MAG TPA: NAD(P)H-hydrate dehydratase [Rhodocyclaceae bacterium]|nr:NAD(P)H-hydrate dehydratase [Rhodocyclaceae bacterium]